MNSGDPVPMRRAVTAGTKLDDIVLFNLSAIVILERIAILRVMTVEAESIVSMLQPNFLVFHPETIHLPFGFDGFVTFHAIVAPAEFFKIESFGFPRRGLVQVRIRRRCLDGGRGIRGGGVCVGGR